MQEQEKLREIESLGEEAEDFQEDAMWEESRMEAGSWGGIDRKSTRLNSSHA